MIRCDACNRHIFARETACPFCASPLPRLRSGLLAAGLVALAGCPAPIYGEPAGSPIYGIPAVDGGIAVDAQAGDAARPDALVADAAADDAMLPDAALSDSAVGDGAAPDAQMADMTAGDMTAGDMTAADMAEADQAVRPDMEVDMFIALPPYGIPPEPERDPE